MKELQIIDQQEVLGKDFKVYGDVENPLFLAKDVAEWIDYSKSNGRYKVSQMISNIDEDEKGIYNVDTLGGNQNLWFLPEDGLYEVLMQSRKPIAKQFKKEVKKILKQMRLTGGAVLDEEKFIKQYFPSFSEDVKQAMVLDLKHQNELYRQQLEEQQPKVQIADERLLKNGCYTITEINRSLGLKRGKLTKWAKEQGYIHKTITEVNESGRPYFKIYDNGGYKAIGITEEGLSKIQENLENIK